MAAPLGNPMFYGRDANGLPLAGGKLYAYAAGTSNLQDTFTDATLATANTNPVILNASGFAPVWCPDASSYKFILLDSTGTQIWTIDGVHPAAGAAFPYPTQFTPETGTVAYVSATSFSVTGNVTGTYTVGRIIQSTNSAGTVYSQVKSSSFSTVTTVVVDNFSGTLDAGLSAINYGISSAVNGALPAQNANKSLVAVSGNAGTLSTTVDALLGDGTYVGTVLVDTLSEWSLGVFTPKVTGKYRVSANVGVSISGVTFTAGGIGVQTKFLKTGTAGNGGTINHSTPIGTTAVLTAGGNGSIVYSLTAGTDTIKVTCNATFTGGSPVPTWNVVIERVG